MRLVDVLRIREMEGCDEKVYGECVLRSVLSRFMERVY